MIKVENIIFEYPGKRALDDVTFHVKTGSVCALVGPNGAGKSTLMRSIAALDDVFSGKIHVNGVDVQEDPRQVHRSIGYLSDFFGLYDDLTVRQCLNYVARAHRIPSSELQSKIDLAVKRLNLHEYIDAKASTLSRGWRQRLGIAQAIIHEPQLLLLDEPASGLDPEARQELSELFLSLRDQGMTLMVSSHILAELEDYCTDMLLLRNGKVFDHHIADTKPELQNQFQLVIEFLTPAENLITQVGSMSTVSNVKAQKNIISCTFNGGKQDQHELLKALLSMNLPVVSFNAQEKRLQDIYMDIALKGDKKNAN
ncbi:MAG: ABC transporter ATP-binding protein [Methyloligellaceae bacterium]